MSMLIYGLVTVGVAIGGAALSISQANAAQKTADWNAGQQEQQANQQLAISQYQARLESQQNEANYRLAQMDAQARGIQAQNTRDAAEAQAGADRENIRRDRDKFDRVRAAQEAAIAKSGVLPAGSPLAVLTETKRLEEQTLNDQQFASNANREGALYEAELEQFGADAANYSALIARKSGNARANLINLTGLVDANASKQRANLERLAGAYQKRQALYSGIAGVATSAAGAYGGYKKYNVAA